MNRFLRPLIYLALIIFVFFVATKPYNWFCKSSGKCTELNFGNIFKEKEGTTPISIALTAVSRNNEIEFSVLEPKLINSVSSRKNIVSYHIANLSDKAVKFRPKLSVFPAEYEKYIERGECLCHQDIQLKAGETVTKDFSFKLKKEIDSELAKQNRNFIQISYTIEK